jgi:hypothetical protein
MPYVIATQLIFYIRHEILSLDLGPPMVIQNPLYDDSYGQYRTKNKHVHGNPAVRDQLKHPHLTTSIFFISQ